MTHMTASVISAALSGTPVLATDAAGPAGSYIDWGVIHVSVTNVFIIVGMLLLFAAAVLVPFPRHHDDGGEES